MLNVWGSEPARDFVAPRVEAPTDAEHPAKHGTALLPVVFVPTPHVRHRTAVTHDLRDPFAQERRLPSVRSQHDGAREELRDPFAPRPPVAPPDRSTDDLRDPFAAR